MADYIISSGETESGIILENNFMTVLDGGTANSTTVNSRGRLDVSSGGIATDIMENGGYVYVADGAEASFVPNTFTDLNLYDDYEATVHSGTTANNTMLNGGSIRIFSGGTAIVTRNRNGNGRIFVSNGGLTSLTHVNRPVGYENIAVFSGGLADFTVLNGSMNVSNGGSAINTIVNSTGVVRVLSGGVANNTIVNSMGLLYIDSGGTATNVVAQEGEIGFSLSPDTFVQGICDSQTFLVKDSIVSGFVIKQTETLMVSEGEKAVDTTIIWGGLIVSSGGIANNTIIRTRSSVVAQLEITSGGVANNTTIENGGLVRVGPGGIANGITANSSTQVYVYSGGIVNEAEINATQMMVNTGGIVNSIMVGTGAALIVHSGVKATAVRENGGYVSIYEGADVSFVPNTFGGLVISMFSASLHSGTTANDTIVNSSGKLYVWSGGIARDVLVNQNGGLAVSSGGKLTGRVIDLGGKVSLADGATLDFDLTQVNPGTGARVNNLTKMFGSYVNQNLTITIKADQDEGLYKLAEGAADFNRTLSVMNTAGETFGTLAVGESISISGINYSLLLSDNTLSLKVGNAEPVSPYTSDGLVFSSGTVVVESGEVFHDTIMGGGTLNINSGGTLKTAALYGSGRVYVSSGGIAEDVVVRNNSRGSFDILDGGTLNGATVSEGAILRISSGGTAVEVRENGGYVDVQDGANVSFVSHTFSDGILGTATLHSGTTAYRATLTSGGKLYLSGGMANDIQIERSGGSIFVLDGGRASGITFLSAGRTVIHISSGGVVDNVSNNEASFSMSIFDGGSADNVSLSRSGRLFVSGGGTATNVRIGANTVIYAEIGAVLDGVTVHSGASFVVSSGVTALNIVENGGVVKVLNGAEVSFASNTISGLCLSGGSFVVHSGTTLVNTFLGGEPSTPTRMHISEGGIAVNTWINNGFVYISSGGMTNRTTLNSGAHIEVMADGAANSTTVYSGRISISSGGMANATMVCSGGITVDFGGIANSTTVNSGGSMNVSSGGKLTGQMSFANGVVVSAEEGSILDFDISELTPEAGARVNNLAIIDGTPFYTLTVSDTQTSGLYTLAEGATYFDIDSTITVKNTLGESLGALAAGETVTINGKDYLLTNENSVLSVTVANNADAPAPKWTYLVYMAADSNLSRSALYDIISMQQAECNPQIDIYVLADRAPAGTEGSGDYETINGTYRWDSDWEDTRVGKLTSSPGLTVTVDWESWGELDTGSIETLERFVNWVQEESPADNYGLILWDHGREDAEFCWDLTTDPDWGACIRVSEVSDLLKKKGNIPIVIFNACLFSSELVVTQMAGSTDVIVVSEPTSYGETITYNYNMFFRTITPDMTPQEMAAIMVRNVGPQYNYPGDPTMLTSIDVTGSRLAETLDALAEAVAAADNDADKVVLIQAMLKAPQNGSNYDGSSVQQSDLGFIIRDVMADPDYESTSEEFKKALADVKTALESIVLEYRSMPANRGSGIAVFNPVYTAMVYLNNGLTPEAIGMSIHSYLNSCYESNLLWAALLDYLGATYLEEVEAGLVPTSVFSVSDVDGLVDGRTVSVSDIGCFSGRGERFDCIRLHDEMFFGFVITADDKSTGSFTVSNDADAAVTVSLLAADGTVVETGTGSVSFQNLSAGSYYLRLQSETDCGVTLSSEADWWTGVDRFDYAGSGQNEKHVNGNGSPETATALATGLYSGLITCQGDTDCYLIADTNAPLYIVEVYGEEGWTVGEYDAEEGILHKADYSDGKYTLIMEPGSYFLVEGTADLANGSDLYSLNVIAKYLPVDVTLDLLAGTQDGVSWEPSVLMDAYTVECSMDGFDHALQFVTTGTAVDLLNLPVGTYQWRVTTDSGEEDPEWYDGEEIVSDNTTAAPKVFRSNSDSNDDIFFATPADTWNSRYYAKHFGSVGDWNGTGEMVSAAGKGRIQDMFFGSADPGSLFLTDSENGDALFLDDIYTGLPEEIEENTARLFRVRGIFAGAGDDIVDMTSQRFQYIGGNLLISGGDGDDVIWANRGARNSLFGDAGNDRIVGASGDDVIAGGIGDDRLHGGGGDDIFTFCENWGTDTVEQLETGTVTLWFLSGSMENWNAETLTYSDGENSVTVSGVSADQVTLKFELGKSSLFGQLYNMGAFSESLTKKIFDDTDKGYLASL